MASRTPKVCANASTAGSIRVVPKASSCVPDPIRPLQIPALKIKDTGTVGLPLSSRDAAAINEASHPAPFGKGSETMINACDIKLRNPQKDQWVQNNVLPVCAEQFGLSLDARPYIHAELYKLLLYDE